MAFGTLARTAMTAVIVLGTCRWFLLPRSSAEVGIPVGPGRPADHPEGGGTAVLDPPPAVAGDSARDWLTRHSLGRASWPQVVASFYEKAAQDPEVLSYFHGVDMDRLQRHFVAALAMVISKGVSGSALVRMQAVHRTVVDLDGRPITTRVFDKVISALAESLGEAGVPSGAIAELARLVEPMREVIVPADR